MKRILPIILCCFISGTFSFAQISKGTVLLGGDLSFNTQTSKDGNMEYKSNGFLISPVIAKAVKQNVFWGGSLSFGSNEYNPPSPGAQQKLSSYGAGIFYRKYKPVMGKFYAFLQAGVNGSFGKNKYRQNPDYYYDDKTYSFGLNITPGVSIGVSKKLFLEAGFNNIASLNYQHSKTTGYNFVIALIVLPAALVFPAAWEFFQTVFILDSGLCLIQKNPDQESCLIRLFITQNQTGGTSERISIPG